MLRETGRRRREVRTWESGYTSAMGTGVEAMDARRVDSSSLLDAGVRLGLVVYGIVHLVIAITAVQVAFGDRSEQASQQGAMAQLAQSPFGDVGLVVVAAGLVAMVVWQLVEAAVGHQGSDGGKRLFKRVASLAKAVVYGVLAYSAVETVAGSGSSGSGTDSMTARVMSAPAGQLLVGAVGVGVVVVGGYLAFKGVTEKFTKDLDVQAKVGRRREPIILLGKVGYVGKGAALAAVGALFVVAAAQHEAKESGGLDVALQELLRQPLGVPLVLVVALALASFGLYCFAWARHLDR
jgi:Domain of Unknown Function (DUF1206)